MEKWDGGVLREQMTDSEDHEYLELMGIVSNLNEGVYVDRTEPLIGNLVQRYRQLGLKRRKR